MSDPSAPTGPTASIDQVRSEAGRHIVRKLGDRLWPGEPVFDERRGEWRVPIHSRSLPTEEVIGTIRLDTSGQLLHSPNRGQLRRKIEHTRAGRKGNALTKPSVAPVFAAESRPVGDANAASLPVPDLPNDPHAAGEELVADPELRQAYRYLRVAFEDPELRPDLLLALRKFARAARK